MIKPLKKLILGIITNSTGIWLAARILPGFSYSHQTVVLPTAALLFALLEKMVKPLLKLIFLPLNILTFGLFSLIISGMLVYILSLLVNQITIASFYFPGLSYAGFIIPSLFLNQLVVTVLAALVIRLTTSFLYWLIK